MVLIGISWLFFWALINWFSIALVQSALITGLVFVVVALLFENRDRFTRPRV
jgi:hypothetical protein